LSYYVKIVSNIKSI